LAWVSLESGEHPKAVISVVVFTVSEFP